MNALTPLLMTAEQFLAWAQEQPGRARVELVRGRVVEMAPERAVHALTKGSAFMALHAAVQAAQLRLAVFPDGMAVVAGADSVFEPDLVVQSGPMTDADAKRVDAPLIVVEVLSPSTACRDIGAKLASYFSLPSVAHYLILDPDARLVVWHARGPADAILTRVLSAGALTLDPPGLGVDVAALFPTV